KAMQEYFRTWQFRHPAPEDLREILTAQCQCDLGWFFDELIGTNQLIDYRMTEAGRGQIHVENVGSIAAPLQVIAYRNNEILHQQWYRGFKDRQILEFPFDNADRIQIYKHQYTLDASPGDNMLFIENDRIRRSRLKVRMVGGRQDPGMQYLN